MVPRSCRRLGSVWQSGLGAATVMVHIRSVRAHDSGSESRVCGSMMMDRNGVVLFHSGGSDRRFSVTRWRLSGRAPDLMANRWWWLQQCRSSSLPLPQCHSSPHHHPRHRSRTSVVPSPVTSAFLCLVCFFSKGLLLI
jgi:hypothetical protein